MNVWNIKSLNKGGRGSLGNLLLLFMCLRQCPGRTPRGLPEVGIILCLFMVETKVFAYFSPGKTVTRITPRFPWDLEPCPEVPFHVFLTVSLCWFLLPCCYRPERTCTRMRTVSQCRKPQVADVISNRGAGEVPNLISAKYQKVFSLSVALFTGKNTI